MLNFRIKISLIILLAGLHLSVITAQKWPIHYTASGKPLSSVLEDISGLTTYRFSYNPKRLDVSREIDVDIRANSISEALSFLSMENIEFTILEDHIILKPAKERKEPDATLPVNHTLNGSIKDAFTGEDLVGATIAIPGTSKGAITNGFGFYSLALPQGTNTIQFSFVGYRSESREINLQSDTWFNIILQPDTKSIEEVVVVYSEADRMLNPSLSVSDHINTERTLRGFTGEGDLIRSLTSLPGISFYSDGSAMYYVRGGDRDQNLILIDDAPVYNPAHMLGIFSVFPPEALKSVNIYKGEMPASYGGRLSSVLDVRMKDGNSMRTSFSGNTGPISTTLMLESPLFRKNGSFLISTKRSHLKWLIKPNSPSVENLYFSDLNAKFNVRLNEKNRLFFSAFLGSDKYRNRTGRIQSEGLAWQNTAVTLRWNHLFNPRLFANTSLIGSLYNYNLYTSYELKNRWNSAIGLFALKTDFTWYPGPTFTFRFGASSGAHFYAPGNFLTGNRPDPLVTGVPNRQTIETVVYGEAEQKLSDKLTFRYGLRMVSWTAVGPTTEFRYDGGYEPTDTIIVPSGERYYRHVTMEPRLSLGFKPSANLLLRLAYSRNAQFEYLISNSISPFTSLEVWLPAGPNIPPMTSDLVNTGLKWSALDGRFTFSYDMFTKLIDNYISYTDHAYMLFNPQVESELRYGTGRSRGIELEVGLNLKKLNVIAAYSLSRTSLTIPGINSGKPFPASYHRPHIFNFGINYAWRPGIRLSTNWVYASGHPFTSPGGFYLYNNYRVPYYPIRNNSRLPAYHRLDAAAEIRLNKTSKPNEHWLNISVFNLYGRRNPFNIHFNKITGEDGRLVVPADHYSVPEYQPGMMYVYGMIPGISYQFRF